MSKSIYYKDLGHMDFDSLFTVAIFAYSYGFFLRAVGSVAL
jgi:hypothetical protein